MAAFIAAAFGLGAASSLINSRQQVKNLKDQSKLKYKEAATLFEDAANLAQANSYNEDMLRRQTRMDLSLQRAAIGQSGLSGGTLIDLDIQTEQNMEADILAQRWNDHTAYIAKKYAAQNAAAEATYLKKAARRESKYGWTKALLGGASMGMSTAAASGAFKDDGS